MKEPLQLLLDTTDPKFLLPLLYPQSRPTPMFNNQSSQSPRRADFTFDRRKNEDPLKNLDTTARANPINSRKKIEPLPGQATAEKVDPANEFATKRSGASKEKEMKKRVDLKMARTILELLLRGGKGDEPTRWWTSTVWRPRESSPYLPPRNFRGPKREKK